MLHVTCDYCGADDAATVFPVRDTNYGFAGDWKVVRCRRCGLVYLNPRPHEEEIGQYYPDGEYTCFSHPRPTEALGKGHHFIQMADAVGLRSGRVCDIGCGVGDFLAAAHVSGWQVAGIEPNPHALQACQARLPNAPVFATLAQAAFTDRSFDAVTLWHVFEHLPSPTAALKEIWRVLRPGGLLGIAVPNFGSFERRIWGKRWIAIQAPTHLYHFESHTLMRYLQDGGFQTLSITQASGANSLAANLLRTARALMLDPLARHNRTATSAPVLIGQQPRPERSRPGYVVSSSNKERALQLVTKAVSPIASFIARLGYGPELLVYARKCEEETHFS